MKANETSPGSGRSHAGTFTRCSCRSDYPEGPIVGFEDSYTTFKDVITLGGESGGVPFTARWKLDGDELRFTDISGRPDDNYIWGHTWIRER